MPQPLPQDLLDWVTQLTGGTVAGYQRHAARREAWRIDVNTEAGTTPYFLRLDRAQAHGKASTRNLQRETELIQALKLHDIPAQTILGWNPMHCAALQCWVTGSGRQQNLPREQQHPVMLDFMAIMARLHRIDINSLDLPLFEIPRNPLEHSLLEIEAVEEPDLFPQSACTTNPLAAFGKRWLIQHAPQTVQATSLVQGDTGPGNFMSEGDRVTALVDWEWGHFGDPMEDLGNVWLRDFFNPTSGGDLRPYFEHYRQHSGFDLDYDSIAYYRVHQLLRSVIGLDYLTEHLDWKTPVPLNLGYRAVIDLETCRAIAEADGIALAGFEPLAPSGAAHSVHETLAVQLEQLVRPQLNDAFTSELVQGQAATLRYLELQQRYRDEHQQRELDSLKELLGHDISSLHEGQAQLLSQIQNLSPADEPAVLQHLYLRASQQAQQMAPLMTTWQDCQWARIR